MYVSSQYYGKNIADKFTKLSKIGFSMKSFTVDFSQVSNKTVKIDFLNGQLQFQTKKQVWFLLFHW